jgi:hypothetical protein
MPWDEAENLATQGLDLAAAHGYHILQGQLRCVLAFIAAGRGHLDLARTLSDWGQRRDHQPSRKRPFRDGEPGLHQSCCGPTAGHAWATELVSWLLPAGWPGAEVGRDRAGSGARQSATPSMTSASSLSGTAAACRVVR